MAKTKTKPTSGDADLGGFLGGLTNLIEKLGDLAEKGKDLHELKEFGDQAGIKGVYGFTIRPASVATGAEGSRSSRSATFAKTSERARRRFKK